MKRLVSFAIVFSSLVSTIPFAAAQSSANTVTIQAGEGRLSREQMLQMCAQRGARFQGNFTYFVSYEPTRMVSICYCEK